MFDISTIDKTLLDPEIVDARYANSPFVNLKVMGPKQKGKRYEKITEFVLNSLGYNVSRSKTTDYDRIVDGLKCEIKGSMLNKNVDVFSFLQIRPKQEYDKIIFTMFYPNEIVIMEMSKNDILINIDKGIFKKQHGGNKAKSETYMYYGNKETLLQIGAKVINGKNTI